MPGLLRGVARTAVVAGTATAVSNRVSRRQARRWGYTDEPSGGYERGVIRALLTAGLSVRRINPNRLRQFARARGALAKNDRLDPRLIAEYVATMPTRVVRHDPAAEDRRDRHREAPAL